jgi:hypothetical protein
LCAANQVSIEAFSAALIAEIRYDRLGPDSITVATQKFGATRMSWRNESTMISNGNLITMIVSGGILIAFFALLLAAILMGIFATPPIILFVAVLIVLTLSSLEHLIRGASFYLRRTARRKRMQRARQLVTAK